MMCPLLWCTMKDTVYSYEGHLCIPAKIVYNEFILRKQLDKSRLRDILWKKLAKSLQKIYCYKNALKRWR